MDNRLYKGGKAIYAYVGGWEKDSGITRDNLIATYELARNFDWHEVRCHHCGELPPITVIQTPVFRAIARVADMVRHECARPVVANSWWRCAKHPIEAVKEVPGVHSFGAAIDFAVSGGEPLRCIQFLGNASDKLVRGRLGIGLRQHGPRETRYMHVDVGGNLARWRKMRPWIWTYT